MKINYQCQIYTEDEFQKFMEISQEHEELIIKLDKLAVLVFGGKIGNQ